MNSKKVLVTGGAGYLGSFIVRALLNAGFKPIIFDDLGNGHRESIPSGVELRVGNLQRDIKILDEVFKKEKPRAVIHFAGFIEAGESVKDPQKYFLNNVMSALNLLKVMMENQVFRLVFSSSAAVYGEPKKIPIDEEDSKFPTNTYGETKLMVEKILQWYSKAYDFNSIALRYFNACGAALDGSIGEDHDPETHLIPLAIQAALGQRKEFTIFGNDYPTPDGSCIRDYIHVLDLAQAHVVALESLLAENPGFRAYNVGTGKGYSVIEVVETLKKISKIDFASPIGPRRSGDPARLVAKADKIRKELIWEPKYSDLETVIQSAWQWHKNHQNGYNS